VVLLVSGWLQADGRPNRHWKPDSVAEFLSVLFAVARLMASRRCQNALRSPRSRDVEGVGYRMEEEKETGGRPHAGVKGSEKESYPGITRLLRSADSPEEIIAATHVSDYGYRARPSCTRIDSQDIENAAGIVAKARKARINCRAEMDFRRSRRRFFYIDRCLPSTCSRLAVVIGDWFRHQTDVSAFVMNSGCEEKF